MSVEQKKTPKKRYTGAENIIVLHGDNKLAINEYIAQIVADAGDFMELNTSRLDGAESSQSEIAMQLHMLPMGTGKRKVIVENADQVVVGKKGMEWFKNILKNFPETTQWTLVLNDSKKYNRGWTKFKKSHWLRKAISDFSGETYWKESPLPDQKHMPDWIQSRAKALGGVFHPTAAHKLAMLVENDLFQAEQEIQKAIAYTGSKSPVTGDVVDLLCAASKEENIFSLVDAVGQRNGKKALDIYQDMILDVSAEYVFSMLVRQIRLLLETSDLMGRKTTVKEITEACDLSGEWQAKKMMNQARHFSTKELKAIYRQLDQIDEGSKTGRISLESVIEALFVSITTKS